MARFVELQEQHMSMTGAIFDCDDTLVDSLWMWREVVPMVFSRHYAGDLTDVQERGEAMGMDEGIELFINECGIDATLQEIHDEMLAEVHERYVHDIKAFPGVHQVVDALREAGVPMAVASCSNIDEVEATLISNELMPSFKAVISACQGYPGKHSPDIYLAAAAALESPVETTWVFEDSPVGCKTAHDAGFKVCGVVWTASEGSVEAMEGACDIILVDGWDGLDVGALLAGVQ